MHFDCSVVIGSLIFTQDTQIPMMNFQGDNALCQCITLSNTKVGTANIGKEDDTMLGLNRVFWDIEHSIFYPSIDFGKWILDRLFFKLHHVNLNFFTFCSNHFFRCLQYMLLYMGLTICHKGKYKNQGVPVLFCP
jgi:hypothetical protein